MPHESVQAPPPPTLRFTRTRLALFRLAKIGPKQKELSQALGIYQGDVSYLETGAMKFREDFRRHLEATYGCPMEYLAEIVTIGEILNP